MSFKFILPPVHEEASLPQLGARGEWAGSGLELLSGLSAALKRVQLNAGATESFSTPDVWAQTEVFRAALADTRSALHLKCRGEWRGLLALFALAEANHQYDLTVTTFELSQPQELPRLLARLAPVACLNAAGRWQRVGLIQVDGECLGMLVPSTLVCPSRTPAQSSSRKVPWLVEGRLTDPTSARTGLSSDDLRVLARYCGVLLESYPPERFRQVDKELLSVLVRELESFRDSALASLGDRGETMAGAELTTVILHFPIPDRVLYEPLQRTARVESGRGSGYEYESVVRLREDLSTAWQGLVLYEPQLAGHSGRPAREVRFWRGISLERMEQEAQRRQARERITQANYLYVTAADFFTPKLSRVKSSTDSRIRLTTHGEELKGFLLPFTPLALLVHKPQDLLHRVEITEQPDGGYRVTLTVTLHSSNGREPRPYRLEKVYAEKDVVNSEIPAALSVWPNFQSPRWSRYFMLYSGLLELNFAIRGLISVPGLTTFLNPGERSLEELQTLGTTFGTHAGAYLEEALTFNSEGTALGELYQSTVAPEAVYCDRVLDRDKGDRYVPREERVPVGLLLLPRRASVDWKRPTASWVVGVDLGTTKTTVYRSVKGEADNLEALPFDKRVISPFTESDTSRNAHRDCIPQCKTLMPFMTALRTRKEEAAAQDRGPLRSCFIEYVDDFLFTLAHVAQDSRLKLNLKWSTAEAEDSPLRNTTLIGLYLEQVVMQAAAEAFDKQVGPERIEWRFSCPEAFRPDQYRQFREAAQQAVARFTGPTDLPRQRVLVKPESLCTARYFQETLRLEPRESLVTLDIGGQTTDVTLWHEGQLRWRGSLRLAGRHLLIDLLAREPFILKELLKVAHLGNSKFKDRYEKALQYLDEAESPERQSFSIETLLGNTELGERFLLDLNEIAGLPEIKKLEQVALLGFAGLLYYIALTLRTVLPLETGTGSRSAPVRRLALCVGGRVSSLFEYLLSEGARREQMMSLFAAALTPREDTAAGDRRSHWMPGLYFSEHPKHEVAYGLVTARDWVSDQPVGRERTLILGEEVSLGEDEEPLGAEEPMDALLEQTDLRTAWQVTDLRSLRGMLRLAQEHLKIKVHWPLHDMVVRRINAELDAAARALDMSRGGEADSAEVLQESTALEPVYIIALRTLLGAVIAGESAIRDIST